MSARTTDSTQQGVSMDGSTRRIAPAVFQVSPEDAASLGEIEGHLVVLYGEADSAALEEFDRAVETGEADSFVDLAAEKVAADGEKGETVVSADLSYHGETVARDLELGEGDSFGVTLVSYNGGELDEMGFKVEESGEPLEYRVVAVPPALEKDELETAEVIPADAESMINVSTGTEFCVGVMAAASFGFAVGATLVGTGMDGLSARMTELSQAGGEVSADDDIGASFEELVESYS